MTAQQRATAWIVGFFVFLAAVFVLRGVLLPFVAGMAVAYFLDPACDRLEKLGCSRALATTIITACFFALLVTVLIFVAPLLYAQMVAFAERVPGYLSALNEAATPAMAFLQQFSDGEDGSKLREAVGGYSADIVRWLSQLLGRLLSGIDALAGLAALVVLTPIVTFYMLRDWDRIVADLNHWLPRAQAETIREQAALVDQTLAAFVRGQSLVCILLGFFYAIGLTLAGLEFGIIVGFMTGLISFVPYFGMLLGFLVGTGLAIAQFGELVPVLIVASVFVVGQFIEGNFVTPKIVGERVGLHPVWIIFALLAGGALFGFVGVLLAVPVAAVVGVLTRFLLSSYLASALYSSGTGTIGSDDREREKRDRARP
jgi:predicted PurR-regulated permease PerM